MKGCCSGRTWRSRVRPWAHWTSPPGLPDAHSERRELPGATVRIGSAETIPDSVGISPSLCPPRKISGSSHWPGPLLASSPPAPLPRPEFFSQCPLSKSGDRGLGSTAPLACSWATIQIPAAHLWGQAGVVVVVLCKGQSPRPTPQTLSFVYPEPPIQPSGFPTYSSKCNCKMRK